MLLLLLFLFLLLLLVLLLSLLLLVFLLLSLLSLFLLLLLLLPLRIPFLKHSRLREIFRRDFRFEQIPAPRICQGRSEIHEVCRIRCASAKEVRSQRLACRHARSRYLESVLIDLDL